MCLAVPGKVVEVRDRGAQKTGTVDFQGSTVEINLTLLPEVGPGDWVLVHAGLAITQLDEKEALETWNYLKEAGLTEQDGPLSE